MIGLTRKSLTTAALSVSAILIAGSAVAGGTPEPPKDLICHNIGGPRDLGANCEATGNCIAFDDEGQAIVFTNEKQYLGIVIGASDQSAEAHFKHGDGFVELLFDPPLHLASVQGPHKASNVECMATRRDDDQPPEPGN